MGLSTPCATRCASPSRPLAGTTTHPRGLRLSPARPASQARDAPPTRRRALVGRTLHAGAQGAPPLLWGRRWSLQSARVAGVSRAAPRARGAGGGSRVRRRRRPPPRGALRILGCEPRAHLLARGASVSHLPRTRGRTRCLASRRDPRGVSVPCTRRVLSVRACLRVRQRTGRVATAAHRSIGSRASAHAVDHSDVENAQRTTAPRGP